MQDIDRDTLMLALKGNLEAFEKVYRATSDFIYNVAYRVTNNKEDAEEVSQDVALKIYNKLPSFRFRSSFKTWAYRIAVNAAINAYKRKSKEKGRRADYDDTVALKTSYDIRQESIDREDDEALLKSMLDILNPDQRTCVILKDIEGLSYKEVAEVLKININTVRSRLKRAREALMKFRQKGGNQ